MKTTHQNILQRTGLTELEYNDIIFNTYLMCMSEISRNPNHLQLLLINKPINKWFLTEVKKLNKEFIEVTIPYIPLAKIEVEKAYRSYITRITQNYPSALIGQIKIHKNIEIKSN